MLTEMVKMDLGTDLSFITNLGRTASVEDCLDVDSVRETEQQFGCEAGAFPYAVIVVAIPNWFGKHAFAIIVVADVTQFATFISIFISCRRFTIDVVNTLICRQGRLVQIVLEERRADHENNCSQKKETLNYYLDSVFKFCSFFTQLDRTSGRPGN